MTTPSGRRLSVNPIPYWSKAGKTKEVCEEAFADFAKIGYSAVKADVPDGMEAAGVAAFVDGGVVPLAQQDQIANTALNVPCG